jgi:hypothetical protein
VDLSYVLVVEISLLGFGSKKDLFDIVVEIEYWVMIRVVKKKNNNNN